MMEFGSRPTDRNLLIGAQFLHKELPIRIARRAIELETLPYGLSQKPAVLKVTWVFSFVCVLSVCGDFLMLLMLGFEYLLIFKWGCDGNIICEFPSLVQLCHYCWKDSFLWMGYSCLVY